MMDEQQEGEAEMSVDGNDMELDVVSSTSYVGDVDERDRCGAKNKDTEDDSDLDLDLDALLGDDHEIHDTAIESTPFDRGVDVDQPHTKSSPIASDKDHPVPDEQEAKEDLDLDALLDNNGGETQNAKDIPNEDFVPPSDNGIGRVHRFDISSEKESCLDTYPFKSLEDELDVELDALLDGDDIDAEIEFEVTDEEPTNQTAPNATKDATIDTNACARKITTEKGVRRTLFRSPTTGIETKKKSQTKSVAESRIKMTRTKQTMEEIFQRNSASISNSFSKSKKKIASTGDKVRNYSRDLTKRASDRIKNDVTSSMGTPSFMSSTLSSTRKLGGKIIDEFREKDKVKQLRGFDKNSRGLPNFMRPTATFSKKVSQTQSSVHEKAELKRINAMKIKVNLTPWKNKPSPIPTSVMVDEDSKGLVSSPHSPRRSQGKEPMSPTFAGTISSTTKVETTRLIQQQKAKDKESEIEKCIVNLSPRGENVEKSPPFLKHNLDSAGPRTPRGVFGLKSPRSQCSSMKARATSVATQKIRYESPRAGDKSVASLSSYCTVGSFVSPIKAGIPGCQNKFDSFLYKTRGACELCVFQLSASERSKLDERGRHLLVQFTTGGCRDCKAFPKPKGTPPVRLCRKCHASSHRQVQLRRRKKGNGTLIGYSFAKVTEGKIH